MNWLIFALLAPFFFSIVNHFDKYLLRRYFADTGSSVMIMFSSLIGLIAAPVFFLVHPEAIWLPWRDILPLLGSGTLFILATYAYFKALEQDDASLVVPLFQMIPVFTYALGFLLLGETLTSLQLVGSAIIILGAFAMCLDTNETRWKMKWSVLGFIAISSCLFSLDTVFFKTGARGEDFWTSAGWQYVGFLIPGLFMLAVLKKPRQEFFALFRTKATSILSLNVLNELINLLAKLCVNAASLLAPVALVSVVNGFQPFFVFAIGFLLTLFLPAVAKEDIRKKTVIRKLACMIVMIAGAVILER